MVQIQNWIWFSTKLEDPATITFFKSIDFIQNIKIIAWISTICVLTHSYSLNVGNLNNNSKSQNCNLNSSHFLFWDCNLNYVKLKM